MIIGGKGRQRRNGRRCLFAEVGREDRPEKAERTVSVRKRMKHFQMDAAVPVQYAKQEPAIIVSVYRRARHIGLFLHNRPQMRFFQIVPEETAPDRRPVQIKRIQRFFRSALQAIGIHRLKKLHGIAIHFRVAAIIGGYKNFRRIFQGDPMPAQALVPNGIRRALLIHGFSPAKRHTRQHTAGPPHQKTAAHTSKSRAVHPETGAV
jgi:hypothetical protein